MGCGARAVVSFKMWGMGLMEEDAMEWERVGDSSVGGSYLKVLSDYHFSPDAIMQYIPDTHHEHFIPFDGYTNTLEHIRKSQHTPSIASCAFWEHGNRAVRPLANILQTARGRTRRVWRDLACHANHT